jgi:hypothetical protein
VLFSVGSRVMENWIWIRAASEPADRIFDTARTLTGYTSIFWVGTSPPSSQMMKPEVSRGRSARTSALFWLA